ncbi:YjbH domain-containing protein, partial [Vibrio anguillarum]|uniref:YjbH domain-containing protein n=1 Tax=Vibrio anguillarum TaxID=55601 RepID=UPI00188A436B
YTDKGMDFKVRLIEESYWLPETSIGVRDFGGTGMFDGEFVAATKRFGNLDFTLGIGWGYIGQSGNVSNPVCKISDRFCNRPSDFKDNGGMVDFERWFKGPAALYGGIEYQTPYEPLRIKIEYDGNDYSEDGPQVRANSDMTQHTPWNIGMNYRLGDWGDAKISYQRGDTLTLGFNFYTNFNHMKASWLDTPKPKVQAAPTSNNWQQASIELLHNAGYQQNTIAVSNTKVIVTGEQVKYRDKDEALERAAAVLT